MGSATEKDALIFLPQQRADSASSNSKFTKKLRFPLVYCVHSRLAIGVTCAAKLQVFFAIAKRCGAANIALYTS